MKTLIQNYLNILFLLLLVSFPVSINAQLNGNYTIGAGGDYTTFTDAVNALASQGVAGPVTFDVFTANYNEQIRIGEINGVSSTNTVTFQSNSGNDVDVVLFYTSSGDNDNYVIKLDTASYIIFQNITFTATGSNYGRIFNLSNNSHDISIISNTLVGSTSTSTSDNFTLVYANNTTFNNLHIQDNDFSQGAYAIYISGINNNRSTGVEITGNKFLSHNYMSARFNNVDGLKLNSNESSKDGYYHYYIDNSNGALEIMKNKLVGATNGIYLSTSTGGNPPVGTRGLIANNFITVTSANANGIHLNNVTNQDVYYNSVNVISGNGNAKPFYSTNGGSINVVNNIFSNTGGGYAYYVNTTGAISTSDYNDFYTAGNYLAYWGDNRIDLASLQTASGKDANSVSVLPHFTSSTDLTPASPWIDGEAQVLSSVTDDIDGNPRDGSNPDIGAVEFTADPSVTTPLAGDYTIGSGGNYATIKDAMFDLSLRGISAAVNFNIISGTYNENVNLMDIPGSSSSDTVTIKSQSGNPEDVIWFYAASGDADNYLLKLRNVDHLRIRNITMASNNSTSTSKGIIVNMEGNTDDIVLDNNIFVGAPVSNTNDDLTILYSSNSLFSSRIVTNNTFTGGSYGVYFTGISNNHSSGMVVRGNKFSSMSYMSARFNNVDGLKLNSNESSKDGYYHYYIDNSNGALEIMKNKLVGATNGIYLSTSTGGNPPVGTRGLIANNFITVTSANANGIHLNNVTNQDVYYNSVNVISGNGNAKPFYSTNGGSINVVNNIFSNTGGGYAYYVNTTGAISTSDYNDFYTAGNYLAYWGDNRIDLASLQTASGKDANSISENPSFVSSSNLHVKSAALDGKATPISIVTDDIDGNPRDATTPDIGADEFTPGVNTPPSITSTPDTVANVGEEYSYQLEVEDIDGDTLGYSLTTGPAWLSIDANSGLLTGTPQQSDVGAETVTVEAEDGKGGSDTQTFTINVMSATDVELIGQQIPDHFDLFNNYPNPFNPSTRIRFAVPEISNVKIEVYNLTGEKVTTLINEIKSAGYYEVNFNAVKLASGIYFYRIEAGSFIQVKKMLLLK